MEDAPPPPPLADVLEQHCELVTARVRFLDALGQPLAGARIALLVEQDGGWSLRRSTRADAHGTLEFTLAPGPYGFRRRDEPGAPVVPLDCGTAGPTVGKLRL